MNPNRERNKALVTADMLVFVASCRESLRPVLVSSELLGSQLSNESSSSLCLISLVSAIFGGIGTQKFALGSFVVPFYAIGWEAFQLDMVRSQWIRFSIPIFGIASTSLVYIFPLFLGRRRRRFLHAGFSLWSALFSG